jgi:hypothetical protein
VAGVLTERIYLADEWFNLGMSGNKHFIKC